MEFSFEIRRDRNISQSGTSHRILSVCTVEAGAGEGELMGQSDYQMIDQLTTSFVCKKGQAQRVKLKGEEGFPATLNR